MQSTQKTSAAATTTQSSSTGAGPVTLVQGEPSSTIVQSQLATSTVDGKGATRSNLSQVVGDLGAAHNAHSGWLESETQKITAWGQAEIERLLAQTKGVEERLIAEAQQKQRDLEEKHKGELSKLVQKLDADKAMRLKELEDALQRQIQAALNTSKKDINDIETIMNKRKMELMTQAQVQTSKDVDRLSSLAVEAKLVPSVTRTIIETNTETGTVIAVAGGGQISTGGAAAQTLNKQEIQAVPTAGTLTQEADVKVGTINRNRDGQVVGTGAIVNTQSEVTQHGGQPLIGSNMARAGALSSGRTAATTSTLGSTSASTSNLDSGRAHSDAPLPITATNTTGSAGSNLGQKPHIDAAYGRPINPPNTSDRLHDKNTDRSVDRSDPSYNKHSNDSTSGQESLLDKVKHAITGEPKSSDAHHARV